MDEDFQRHRQMALLQLSAEAFEISKGQFTGQNHPLTTQCSRLSDTGCTGDRHLRRAVDHKIGDQGTGQTTKADVLNDDRVHTRGIRSEKQLRSTGQFITEHQNVEGQKSLDRSFVQPIHDLPEVIDTEVLGPLSGIKGINAEIDGIGTTGHGRFQRSPVASWSQEFRRHQLALRV